LRTRHYGAQTTRTGRVRNELVGVIFADGEIVSNLRWTQSIYDLMKDAQPTQINTPDPLGENDVLAAAKTAIKELMSKEYVSFAALIDDKFDILLADVKETIGDESKLKELLEQANIESSEYAKKHIAKSGDKPAKSSKKAPKATAE
jgi:CRISPR-associated protein Csc2